ncbi:MAG: alpha/beta hydrolase [Bacteroidota bacterium]
MPVSSTIPQKILSFQTEEDIAIVADAYGHPNHPPVLLLHGGGQTRNSWKKTGLTLAGKGWYVIAPDARGHGDSSWSKKGAYTFDCLRKDLTAIVQTLPQKPVLIGASMGGITSLAALHYHPNLAKGLILVDVSPRIEKRGTDRIFAFMSAKPEGYESLEEVQAAVRNYLPHRKNIGSLSGLKKNLRRLPNGNYGWHWDPKMLRVWQQKSDDFSQKETEDFLTNALVNLTIPALLVRGGISDVVSKEIVAELKTLAPSLQFVDVAEAGHMVAGDSNHVFTNALLDFLNDL